MSHPLPLLPLASTRQALTKIHSLVVITHIYECSCKNRSTLHDKEGGGRQEKVQGKEGGGVGRQEQVNCRP